MNRGIARRTMFEFAEDIRVFLRHLGAACERGEIEVHAFSIMTTHYHMLVRSPKKRLGVAMQRTQTEYSRWFNRSRRRDGALVRGRFASKEVDSLTYRCVLVSYIDQNPVVAGLVDDAREFPHGSAKIYGGGDQSVFPQLCREWVESEACEAAGCSRYDPAMYSQVFGPVSDEVTRVVDCRSRSRAAGDALDDLIRAAPAQVLEWMQRKARLADGGRPGLPVLSPESVEREVLSLSDDGRIPWAIGRRCAWVVMRAGLIRQLCGMGIAPLAERLGVSPSAMDRICRLHQRMVVEDEEYAERAGVVAFRALRIWKAGGK